MLVKLTIDTSERNRFFVSSGDFSMTNNLVDLKIYSNTFEDEDQNIHWITNSNDSSSIRISAAAFKWLSKHDLTQDFCKHCHSSSIYE